VGTGPGSRVVVVDGTGAATAAGVPVVVADGTGTTVGPDEPDPGEGDTVIAGACAAGLLAGWLAAGLWPAGELQAGSAIAAQPPRATSATQRPRDPIRFMSGLRIWPASCRPH
jgi:hypothetical protein